jgi:ATP-binding cassette subfamily C (CFTR/MRP) protein 1
MQLAVTLGALYLILGVAATGGLLVCVATLPLNLVVMRRVKVLQDRLMRQKDERMALLSEALGAIRTLKLHAWEDAFEERVAALRRKEVATLLRFQVLNAVTSTLWLTAPTMAGLASFLVKSLLLEQAITPAEGFTSLTLFQLLSISLTFLPSILNTAIQANVGLHRISRFLALPEVDGRDEALGEQLPHGALEVRGGSFCWKAPPPTREDGSRRTRRTRRWPLPRRTKEQRAAAAAAAAASRSSSSSTTAASSGAPTTAPLLAASPLPTPPTSTPPPSTPPPSAAGTTAELHGERGEAAQGGGARATQAKLADIELHVRAGELTVIYGPTGCGKSSLLAALLGDCTREAGEVAVRGGVSYVPQRAWVANATLRENILFGSSYEQSRYDAVLEACALHADIALLPAGDLTEIGERGVNLSGGQQQRVPPSPHNSPAPSPPPSASASASPSPSP